jgi:hypothetical protein
MWVTTTSAATATTVVAGEGVHACICLQLLQLGSNGVVLMAETLHLRSHV